MLDDAGDDVMRYFIFGSLFFEWNMNFVQDVIDTIHILVQNKKLNINIVYVDIKYVEILLWIKVSK